MTNPTTDAFDAGLNGPTPEQPSEQAARPAWQAPTISIIDAKLTETGVNSTTDANSTFS
jgi:hypothetical protein